MLSSHSVGHPDLPDPSSDIGSEPQGSVQSFQSENILTGAELEELGSLEATVERGLRAFWEIGQALQQIRDKRLYRQEYATFEEYCICRWEMSRRSAYQLIEAATVYENVRHGAQILPANERQTRPLVTLPPQKQQEAWAKAVSTAPSGRVTSTHVAQVAKEYQLSSEDACCETGSAASSTPAVPEGDSVIAQTDSNEVGANWRSCWNCYHCSREFLDDPHSFYCYQFGKLNFIEKDGNERGAECELWTYRQATPDEVKRTPLPTETFTLSLQLPAYLQPLIQDAARREELVLVDWVAKVLETALKANSCPPAEATSIPDTVANPCDSTTPVVVDRIEVSVSEVSQVSKYKVSANTETSDEFSEETAAA